jgi:hypothetical protein
VSVFVIDCTTTGVPPPTVAAPILTGTDSRRDPAPFAGMLDFIGCIRC